MPKYRMTGGFITIKIMDNSYQGIPIVPVSTNAETEGTDSQEDLNLEPVAYSYEYYNEMADEWAQAIRSSPETIPDSDTTRVRNVTPLIPFPEVEAAFDGMRQVGENARKAEGAAKAETKPDTNVRPRRRATGSLTSSLPLLL